MHAQLSIDENMLCGSERVQPTSTELKKVLKMCWLNLLNFFIREDWLFRRVYIHSV